MWKVQVAETTSCPGLPWRFLGLAYRRPGTAWERATRNEETEVNRRALKATGAVLLWLALFHVPFTAAQNGPLDPTPVIEY